MTYSYNTWKITWYAHVDRIETWIFFRWVTNLSLASRLCKLLFLLICTIKTGYDSNREGGSLSMYHIAKITVCWHQWREKNWTLRRPWCWMIYYSVKTSKEGNKTLLSTLIYILSFCNSMSESGGYCWKLVMDLTQRHIIVFVFKVSASFASYDFIFSSFLLFNFYLCVLFIQSHQNNRSSHFSCILLVQF